MADNSNEVSCSNCGHLVNQKKTVSFEDLSAKLQKFARLQPTTEFSVGPFSFLLHRCVENVECERFLVPFYEHKIFTILDQDTQQMTNNLKRKYMYRNVITAVWGENVLGAGNRVKIPDCLVKIIRAIAPEDDNGKCYMGYKSVI